MLNTKSKFSLFLCAILLLSIVFGGCSIAEESVESRALCETFVDHVIQDDYTSAYEMIQAVASEEEFQPLWRSMRDVLKNSESYELQQKSWYKNWNNGVTTTQVLFEITTNDGKICQMLIYTMDDLEGIAGLNFLDSTDFVEKTNFVDTVNIVLIIFTLACFAFTIWMFVDCLKRRLKNKVLWAIITLCYIGCSLTTGASVFKFYFRFSLLAGLTNISADRAALAISVNVLLPIGALIYFLLRKRLTLPEEKPAQPSSENSGEAAIPEATQE